MACGCGSDQPEPAVGQEWELHEGPVLDNTTTGRWSTSGTIWGLHAMIARD